MVHTVRCKLGQLCFRLGMRLFPENIRWGTAAMLKAGLAWSKADPENLERAMAGKPINVHMTLEQTTPPDVAKDRT